MKHPRTEFITSRDNPLVKDLKRLSQSNLAYRKQGRVWIEGDHLCRAALLRGCQPLIAVLSERAFEERSADVQALVQGAQQVAVLTGNLFASLSALESPQQWACVLELPQALTPQAGCHTVVLDRLQDAGNVGSIMRSARAFGFTQVLALKGTAALWGGKALRAGMGAHFGLRLIEGLDAQSLQSLGVPLAVTSSHDGEALDLLLTKGALAGPMAWVFGHEGQGVEGSLAQQADWRVRIDQPGGEESLNVAAAAAICLYAARAAGPA